MLLLLALAAVAAADSFRSPDHQLTARLYIAMVHGYQRFGRPVTKQFVRCRYKPTCSEYSIEAVQKYGIRHGLALTSKRLYSCDRSVPFGTVDPVP